MLTYLSPGLRFFHDGQFEGRKSRVSPHLVRRPDEPIDGEVARLYSLLTTALHHPAVCDGQWSLLECTRAWHDNATSDDFIAFRWERGPCEWLCGIVNYSAQRGQCFIRMSCPQLSGRTVRFLDLLGSDVYDRSGDDLLSRGLFVDMPAWGCHVFEVQWLASTGVG